MSYWATWAWDFPHLAVGVSEFVMGFCITWRATHRKPRSERPQWEPGPWHGGRRTYHHAGHCGCSACKRSEAIKAGKPKGKPQPVPPRGGGGVHRGGPRPHPVDIVTWGGDVVRHLTPSGDFGGPLNALSTWDN